MVTRSRKMTYNRACEIMKLNPNHSPERNAKLAQSSLDHFVPKVPLRYPVACDVIIEAATKIDTVDTAFACPHCGENKVDSLIPEEYDFPYCVSCDKFYSF